MNFTELQELLRVELRRRIGRGALSVTLLAKKSGLGQGHISNFLKGRGLRNDSLDKILLSQGMDVAKLIPPPRESIHGGKVVESRAMTVRMVPLVLHTEAIFDALLNLKGNQEWLPFQASTLEGLSLPSKIRLPSRRFVAIRLDDKDVLGMAPVLTPGAVLLLDRHYKSFKQYPATHAGIRAGAVPKTAVSEDGPRHPTINLYALGSGSELLIRYAEYRESRLILRPFAPSEAVEVRPVKSLTEATALLVGRVALILGETPGVAGIS